jgi:hypothetical protein
MKYERLDLLHNAKIANQTQNIMIMQTTVVKTRVAGERKTSW